MFLKIRKTYEPLHTIKRPIPIQFIEMGRTFIYTAYVFLSGQ